jgi:protocatechuate 3,4-dioxygenase alpha subunit
MDDRILLSAEQGTGPLYSFALCFDGVEMSVAPTAPGAVRISGRVLDGQGIALRKPDAMLEFWADGQFARTQTNEDGIFSVVMAKPDPTALPDGRVQAPHLDVLVFIHPLLDHLNTRMYWPDESGNDQDPVLAMLDPEQRKSLIASGSSTDLQFDIKLHGPGETVFFTPSL